MYIRNVIVLMVKKKNKRIYFYKIVVYFKLTTIALALSSSLNSLIFRGTRTGRATPFLTITFSPRSCFLANRFLHNTNSFVQQHGASPLFRQPRGIPWRIDVQRVRYHVKLVPVMRVLFTQAFDDVS